MDSDPQARELVSETLQLDGCEVVSEESPAQLEKILLEHSPLDAILIDFTGPAERNFDLIRLVKEICPWTKTIFISRLTDVNLWIESIQRGAYDYLPKPLDRNELRRVVRNALEKTQ